MHHDVWDYDVPSQPTLVDLRQPDGSTVPALVQPTKRGELFLLDRTRPERRSPTSRNDPCRRAPCRYEWLSQTQPFSTGMPSFRPRRQRSGHVRLTPFDRCGAAASFGKMRYEGHFTPPSVAGTFVFPEAAPAASARRRCASTKTNQADWSRRR